MNTELQNDISFAQKLLSALAKARGLQSVADVGMYMMGNPVVISDKSWSVLAMAPDEDIINNVRLSRCFFYVSDILRQVIENGGVGATEKPKKEKKEPLQIPFEKRSSFAFSEKPIPASEIARRINDLGDSEKMQKLSYNGIISWLSEVGMLTWATAVDGKKTKHPTPSGTEAGILIENRTGSKGPYQVMVYNLKAQHFIIDNLDAVIEAENMDAELKNKPWT